MYLRNVLRKQAWVFPLGVVAFVAILCISLVGCSENLTSHTARVVMLVKLKLKALLRRQIMGNLW